MSDTFSQEERSKIMQRVRGKENNSTELKLIQLFKANGIVGWRRNYPVKGKPDFVFLDKRIVVFTDGCFWHGHTCRNVTPKQNAEYWATKKKRNIDRDKFVTKMFRHRGWGVIRIWECELRNGAKKKLRQIVNRLRQ